VSSTSTNIPSNTALHASPTDNDIDEITTTKEEIHQEATKALSIAGGENAVSYFATIPYLHTTPTTSQQQHRQHRVLFILGGPGAGKGTQSSNIVSTYHCIHLSAGDLLREERAAGAADGGNNADHPHAALIEECLVAGKIVPVAITLSLLQRAMDQATTSSSSSSTTTTHGSPIFLIDGFPRNFDNLSGWVENVSPSTTSVLGALVYDCPIDILEKRIMGRAATSGRSDDNLTSARRRFVTFGKETVPVVQALEVVEELSGGGNGGGLHVQHVRGDGTVDEVWEETKVAMDRFVRHDVLTANVELLTAVEGGDVEGYLKLCSEGMLADTNDDADDGGGDGVADSTSSGERTFHKYETIPATTTGGLRYSNHNAVIDIYDGTEATVSYDRRIETGEGELVAEYRETRVWSHRSPGWVCIHFVRKPITATTTAV